MAIANALKDALDRPALDTAAEPLRNAVRGTYEATGTPGGQLKNVLHGVWLKHPLHPVFTDIPIGAWTTALAMDAMSRSDEGMRRAATFAMGVGLAGAAGAAVTGLTDWSETDGRARRRTCVEWAGDTASALPAGARGGRRHRREGAAILTVVL